METVNGKRFYHINRITQGNKYGLLKIGQCINTETQTYNPFFGVYDTKDISLNNDTLIEAIGYYWHFAREITIEEIRMKNFPEYPSRQRCIWLANKEDLPYWLTQVRGNNMQIVELEVNGKIHECDASLIELQPTRLNEVREKSLQYWNRAVHDPSKIEILFEGEATVVNILK